jgi:hypothetical protein
VSRKRFSSSALGFELRIEVFAARIPVSRSAHFTVKCFSLASQGEQIEFFRDDPAFWPSFSH